MVGVSATAPARGWRARAATLHPRHFFLETWRRIDAQAAETRAAQPPSAYDWNPLRALGVGALMLVAIEYCGSPYQVVDFVAWVTGAPHTDNPVLNSRFDDLYRYGWWAGWRVLGFFLVPALVIRASGQRLRDHGLRRPAPGTAWMDGVLYLAMVPFVLGASFGEEFGQYYPFYADAGRSWMDLLAWELLYALQFVSLEFFFRGWWLAACKRAMGSQALPVMVVPYCMIHFGKPWIEAVAAVGAGVVLGTLAWRTRSIWSGVRLHCLVAWTMDLAALIQKGDLPSRLVPS